MALYFKGLAGTGKSTLINFILKIYVMANSTTFSNDAQKTFAFQNLSKNTYLWAAPEVKLDFAIDQAVFQQLVSQERLSVQAKYMAAKDAIINAIGFLAGNVLPLGWQDYSGSVMRRLFLLNFFFSPKKTDNNLMDRLLNEEFPFIIRKIACAYRYAVVMTNAEGLWSTKLLTHEIWKQHNSIYSMMNPVKGFIEETDFKFNESYWTPLEIIIEQFKTYCEGKNISRKQWTVDLYDQVFRDYKLKVRKGKFRWGKGSQMTGNIVQGLITQAHINEEKMECDDDIDGPYPVWAEEEVFEDVQYT